MSNIQRRIYIFILLTNIANNIIVNCHFSIVTLLKILCDIITG